jgi:hypothetical protein
MEGEKDLSSIDADLVIWGAMEGADKVAEGEVDPEELLGSVSVPGLPDSDSWEGYEGWTAGMVRAVIEKVAQVTDEEPEELLEAAIRSAQWKAERSKLEAEKVERDLRNMARERLLPDGEGSPLRGSSFQRALQGYARARGIADQTPWWFCTSSEAGCRGDVNGHRPLQHGFWST